MFQNDAIPNCKSVCELNEMESTYVVDDIERLIEKDFRFPKADVVIGGFPCQDFSNCGKRMGMKSKRGRLYQSFVDVVKKVKPLIFVCENVQGLLSIPDALETIVSDFKSIGYAVEHQLIDCSNHGIPQKRKRLIIMGVKQSNKTGWSLIDSNRINCQISKYYSHLESPNQTNDKSQKQYSKAKRLSKGQGQTTINMNAYAPTIRSEHHGNIEFRNENRRLTVRECALAQTFPPDHLFGTMSTAYKQIGNAVPPLLSYVVAHKAHEILKRICAVSSNYKIHEEEYTTTHPVQ
jgi:DNA (cytosine-5)-methyltransferase 1